MPSPRDSLHRLFEYIAEQLRDTDPRSYGLSAHAGFLRGRRDLAGLPGVEFDIEAEGDHVWLRIQRLQSNPPPAVPERRNGLIRVGDDPEGPPPSLNGRRERARRTPSPTSFATNWQWVGLCRQRDGARDRLRAQPRRGEGRFSTRSRISRFQAVTDRFAVPARSAKCHVPAANPPLTATRGGTISTGCAM
jgi:hypothetical protein